MSELPDVFIDGECPECGCHYPACEQIIIQDILDDLKEFELKRYSDMIRTLSNLREKLEGKLHDT